MQIQTFEIKKFFNGSEVILHPTVICADVGNYLVDCGYEETFEEFILGLAGLGLDVQDLDAIIISHDDIDHLGAVQQFRAANPKLKVWCSEIEEASVSGRIDSERLVQAESSLPMMPPEYKDWALAFIQQLKGIKRGEVDRVFRDGEEIIDGVFVVHTPGHTKGHVSLHIPSRNTVIANDAVVIENGELNIANPAFTLDMPAAVQSLQKLKSLQPGKLICYHGGIREGDLSSQLEVLIRVFQ